MTVSEVAEVLSGVYDPELAMDIVSLGLVYAIDAWDANGDLAVTITTTSPACPMTDALQEMTEAVLRQAFPGQRVTVEVSFSPAWSVEMADRAALEELGLARR